MTLEAVAICPIDPLGRWYGEEVRACPVCDTPTEIFVRHKPGTEPEEGMLTSGGGTPDWAYYLMGGVIIFALTAVAYMIAVAM